jgi:hypothetical protein
MDGAPTETKGTTMENLILLIIIIGSLIIGIAIGIRMKNKRK